MISRQTLNISIIFFIDIERQDRYAVVAAVAGVLVTLLTRGPMERFVNIYLKIWVCAKQPTKNGKIIVSIYSTCWEILCLINFDVIVDVDAVWLISVNTNCIFLISDVSYLYKNFLKNRVFKSNLSPFWREILVTSEPAVRQHQCFRLRNVSLFQFIRFSSN